MYKQSNKLTDINSKQQHLPSPLSAASQQQRRDYLHRGISASRATFAYRPKTPHGCWQQRDAVALAIGSGDSDWRHKWSLKERVVDGKTYDKLRQASKRQASPVSEQMTPCLVDLRKCIDDFIEEIET
uniref:Uncharacterized protein n=1 Tax=Glossina pallidipes TaxID=7398 RepID=A0A1A9ZIY5_GLOPL